MSTINLECSYCHQTFERSLADHNRRKSKLPDSKHYYCGRSCAAKHRNQLAGGNNNPTQPPPQKGNQYSRKYPVGTSWYVGRCSKDSRSKNKLCESRVDFAEHIEEVWNNQNGLCAISNITLERRDVQGKCLTDNPFMIASLDRIDNDKGYSIGNVQWTSMALNLARNSLGLDIFKEYFDDTVQKSFNITTTST